MSKKLIKFSGLILIIGIISGFILYFSIPSKIILPQGADASIDAFPSFSLTQSCISPQSQAMVKKTDGTLAINTVQIGEFEYDLKILNKIPFKKISVSVVPANYVIPGGEAIGVKLYTEGLLVVAVSEVTGEDGKEYSPAAEADIQMNDRILSVDGIKINSNEEFTEYINEKKGSVQIMLARDEEIIETTASPVISSSDGGYKLGIWVRDSTAGIGTLTFYNPQTSGFASLGHAICDSDTMSVLKVADGSLTDCSIVSVKKGEYGNPGELKGSLFGESIGKILLNNEFGIYGSLEYGDILENRELVEVATRFQVKEGPAVILCEVDGNGVKEYSVEISKISKKSEPDNKGMVVTVTDERLLNITGGIVQGMSGSPIIQNGRIVGAVTHVFVNDPTRGYGIFIENMLAEAEKIK